MNEIAYPIKLFSPVHLTFVISATVLGVFLAIIINKKIGFTRNVLWFCLITALACEFEKILFYVVKTETGYRLPAENLPFNLCPFQVFLILFLTLSEDLTKKKKLISYMYPTLIGGAFMGMLLAQDALNFAGLTDLATYRHFFYHGMLIFLGFYLYLSKPIKFDLKSYGYAIFFCILTMIGGIWINAFFWGQPNTNHMFITRPPADGLPVLNLSRGYTGYLLDVAILGILLITLCYIPVLIKEIPILFKRLKRQKK